MNKCFLVVLIIFASVLISSGVYIYRMLNYSELAYKPFYVQLQGFASQPEYYPPATLNKEIVPIFFHGGDEVQR